MTDLTGWQPIETAPKDKTLIRLYCPEINSVCIGRWTFDSADEPGFWMTPHGPEIATHWQPIPETP